MTRSRWAWPLAVALATFTAFIPALSGDFLNWDDLDTLVNNSYYRGFSWASLRWIFGFHFGHYYPLTWLSFAADYALWGLNPFGFHLANILLHAANAAMTFLIFQKLLLHVRPGRDADSLKAPAALGALLFSVHPLRVESVAWITERSDVLAAFFYLSTLLLYLKGRRNAAVGAYVLSLAAKPTPVMLPLTLLVLDAYPLGLLVSGHRWKALREKLPFFAAAAASGALTLICQNKTGALWSLEALGPVQRFVVAVYNLAFYFYKTLLPTSLLPFYPMPKPFGSLVDAFLASSAFVVVMTASCWLLRRRRPALAAAWTHYVLTLLPVAGLIKTGPQLAADRYSYLSCLSWAVLAAGWLAIREGKTRRLALAGAMAATVVLARLTWAQCGVWKDSETFWSYHIRKNPAHATAHFYLGTLNLDKGRLDEAERFLLRALELDPASGAIHNNLGNLLAAQGKAEEAVRHYRLAIEADPRHPVVRHNLAMALAGQGRVEEAIEALEEELLIAPGARPSGELLEKLRSLR